MVIVYDGMVIVGSRALREQDRESLPSDQSGGLDCLPSSLS